MKKILSIFLLLTLVIGVFVFVGCDNKDTTVTADKLTIKFTPLNGATIDDLEIQADSDVTLPTITRDGFTFRGWYFDETYETAVTVEGLKAKLKEGTITIYAKWEENTPPAPATLTVQFNVKGGNAVTNASIQADSTYTLPTATRDGFNFKGWFFEEGYQTEVTVDALKAKVGAQNSVTVYAKWEEKTVTLRFDTKGGNAIVDKTFGMSNAGTIVLPTPEKSGSKFARWYFDENYQTAYSAAGLSARLNDETIMLYAKWGEILSSDTVTVQGKSGNTVVINPVFDWTNSNNDTGFFVVLKDEEGAVVEQATVTGTHFELTDNLAYGSEYTLEITGNVSDCFRSVALQTVEGSGEVNLNNATLAVAEPFKSHMVIQRGKAINVTGMTQPGVLVAIDFYGETSYTVANGSGFFTFSFAAKEASTAPATITIRVLKDKKLVIEDVLIGDVYLVSGQSNVQRTLLQCVADGETTPEWAGDVTDAQNSDVRYYYQAEHTSATPSMTTVSAFWSKVTDGDESYKNYSAVAFMVGAMLGKELANDGVPVGIIYAAKGDTNITSWKGGEGSLHYNGMIYPLSSAEISGVVWYQGCNNTGKGIDYQAHLTELMANWRTLFRNASLPFYVVQLPCYNGDSGNNYDFSYVRESQLNACQADANAYLIATCDGGEPDNIHPAHKRYLCERIAKSILSTVYGADYLPQGPTYASHEVQGSDLIITVDNGTGLTFTGESIVGFMLAGADGKYFDATATISEGKIVVTSDKVATPVYVKYGFGKCPFLNVYNKDGFLMSPFRTDEYNHNIDLLDYRENATYTSNSGGETMAVEVVDVDGEVGLQVTKPEGTKGYGILELSKWGAIGKEEHALKLRIKGSNSGAKLVIRIVEGSYEMWATPALTDNFTTVQEMTLPISYFTVSNEVNGIIDFQSINRVELIIKDKNAAVTVTVLELRFVDYTRTAPAAFSIKEAKQDGVQGTIKWGFADFAASYVVRVATDTTFTGSSLVVDSTTTGLSYTFDASGIEDGVTYYVAVAAINNLGQTIATNSGMVLRNANRADVANFVFDNDTDFNAYIADKLAAINSNLVMSRDATKGLKVNVHGKVGWMDFIIKMDSGINAGFDALKIYIDLSEYKGQNVKLQLHDSNYVAYTVTLDNSMKDNDGYYIIPTSSFVYTQKDGQGNVISTTPFSGNAIRIKVGVTDYTGGDSDNLYIRDAMFIKTAQS